MIPSRPLLSIVLPSWRTRDLLAECLDSLFAHTRDVTFEVIVVDNASNDGTLDLLASRFTDVRVIANDRNEGFSRACNQGMAAAKGAFMLVLNSDTFVRDDVISRMVRYLEAHPDVSVAGCELRNPDGRRQFTAFRELSIRQSLVEDLWLYKLLPAPRRPELLLGGYWTGEAEVEADWLAGAFLMLRREVLERVGGFNERFFMYGEDTEWCTRVRRSGGRLMFVPLGVVYHHGAASSPPRWSERDRLHTAHLGGLECYALLNGRALAAVYRATKLAGSAVRWVAYAVAGALTGNAYYAQQRRDYGELVAFYAPTRSYDATSKALQSVGAS